MPAQTELVLCDQKGSEMSLYYDTADDPTISGGSSCTSPVWVFNKAVTGDMQLGETDDEEEQSSRAPNRLYKEYGESKSDLEVSGEMMVDPTYDGFKFLNAMRPGSFARNCLVLSTYISNVGAIGFKGKFRNFDRSIAGPQSGQLKQTFKLKPASCVKDACRIIPVNVAVADAIATYDPGVFSIADVSGLAAQILESPIYKSVKYMMGGLDPDPTLEVYTNVGEVIKLLGLDIADKLATLLVQQERVMPDNVSARSARRMNTKPMGIAGFEIGALFEAFEEIVQNAPKSSVEVPVEVSRDF